MSLELGIALGLPFGGKSGGGGIPVYSLIWSTDALMWASDYLTWGT